MSRVGDGSRRTASKASGSLSDEYLLKPVQVSATILPLKGYFMRLGKQGRRVRGISTFTKHLTAPVETSKTDERSVLTVGRSIDTEAYRFYVAQIPVRKSDLPSGKEFVREARRQMQIHQGILMPQVLELGVVFRTVFQFPSP